jgi:hypothetical protein
MRVGATAPGDGTLAEEAAEPLRSPAAPKSVAVELTVNPSAAEIPRVLVVSLPAFYFE